MSDGAAFWDNQAERYAAQPIKDPASYERTLTRVRAHLSTGDDVVELGCGTGSTALVLAGGTKSYVATDVSPGMIEIARRKAAGDAGTPDHLRFEAAGVEQSLEGRSFDAVLGFNLIHLLEHPAASVAAMAGALRPGGRLITKTVCLKGAGFYLKPMIGVLRAIGKAPLVQFLSTDDVDRMMRAAGLRILETGDFPAKPPAHFVVAQKD